MKSADREYSRARWTEGGTFGSTTGVSIGGNTLIFQGADGTIARALGACDREGYTGVLTSPGGYPGTGCGFAYADLAWETSSQAHRNLYTSLSLALDEETTARVDARIGQGTTDFRYAPSVGSFSFTPSQELRRTLLADPALEEVPQTLRVYHRFAGHGNRDWHSEIDHHDLALRVERRLNETLTLDADLRTYRYVDEETGTTFVSESLVAREIAAGRYDLENPFSDEPSHRDAIRTTGLRLERETLSTRHEAGARLAGTRQGPLSWTAGLEFDRIRQHDVQSHVDQQGNEHDVTDVLGSGGASYRGTRQEWSLLLGTEIAVGERAKLLLGGRRTDHDDVGAVFAHRVGPDGPNVHIWTS